MGSPLQAVVRSASSAEHTAQSGFTASSVQRVSQMQTVSGAAPLQAVKSAPSAEHTGQSGFTASSVQGVSQMHSAVSSAPPQISQTKLQGVPSTAGT